MRRLLSSRNGGTLLLVLSESQCNLEPQKAQTFQSYSWTLELELLLRWGTFPCAFVVTLLCFFAAVLSFPPQPHARVAQWIRAFASGPIFTFRFS
jgi:hypothetical protein